jgi:hypothetical protein
MSPKRRSSGPFPSDPLPSLCEHMFPTPQTRMKTAFGRSLRRSIDAAIDFATLGEYGLASAWEDPAAAAGSGTATRARQDTPSLAWRAGAPAAGSRTATLLQPASAAARALRDQQVSPERATAPVCAGQPLRGRALERTLPRAARKRDGMAPREQRCLSDAG